MEIEKKEWTKETEEQFRFMLTDKVIMPKVEVVSTGSKRTLTQKYSPIPGKEKIAVMLLGDVEFEKEYELESPIYSEVRFRVTLGDRAAIIVFNVDSDERMMVEIFTTIKL